MIELFLEDNVQEVAQSLNQFGGHIQKAGQKGTFETSRRIADRMGKPGSSIWYPVRWDSERQRRAFFATNGFGQGIPTVRTDIIPTSWEVKQTEDGCVVSNGADGALFVYGNILGQSQSLIHKDRWPLFKEVVDDEIEKLNTDVERSLQEQAAQDGLEMK